MDISVRDYITNITNLIDFKGYRIGIEFTHNNISNINSGILPNKKDIYDYGKKLNIYNNYTYIDPYLLVSSYEIRYELLKGILNNHDYICKYMSTIDDIENTLTMNFCNSVNKNYESSHNIDNYYSDVRDPTLCDMKNIYIIKINNVKLMNQLKFLVRSLGYFCQIIVSATMKYNTIKIILSDDPLYQIYPIQIKLKPYDEYYGFELDGNRRFVLSDFSVTHNTVCALYMAHYFKLKTLVVVHKSFLLNQWIQKAIEFMGLDIKDIGIIRQNKCIIEDKPLVIGMIHTIAKRDYKDIFSQFGFVIYDEAHHIACKFFSKAPMKIGGSKTLALTATPYRGDQLIKVMYWFTGGTIYQEKAKINKNVVVKMIHYASTYIKYFATKQRWYNKQLRPDTVKMTTNICKIDSKNNSIIKMIDHMRVHEPERKILILSSRISQLNILKKGVDELIQKDIDNDYIEPDEIQSCMYISKTKPIARQNAEENGDIIFASYQMAEEGLDIKHLNTVILACPKKNIIQSIGRIMRSILKAGDVRPMIIDIADDLPAFNKWRDIRNCIYSKCKYEVEDYYLKNETYMTYEDYEKPDFKNKGKNTDKEEINDNKFDINDYINKHIELLNQDNEDLNRHKSILNDLNHNQYESLMEYKKYDYDKKYKYDSNSPAATDLKDILFVEKLTENDFDKVIVKDAKDDDDDKLDLDRDIKLAVDEDELDFNMVQTSFTAKPVNLNNMIIKKKLF